MVTGDAVVLDLRPAGVATRLVAIALDVAVQAGLLFAVWVAVGLLADGGLDAAVTAAMGTAMQVLVIVGYPTVSETLTRGRSLGKLALGLRVVGTDGSPERFRQALARGLSGLVELWLTFGVVALLSSILTPQGRRVGDYLAGTIVVQERSGPRAAPVATMPPALAEWAAGAELSQLDPEVVAMAAQFVERRDELQPAARTAMGERIAASLARGVTPAPPEDATPFDLCAAVLAERRRRDLPPERPPG